jgi:hypothetical protein
VFNVTKEAVVARQAQVLEQLPPTPGTQRAPFAPTVVAPPEWWAEARIPLDDAGSVLFATTGGGILFGAVGGAFAARFVKIGLDAYARVKAVGVFGPSTPSAGGVDAAEAPSADAGSAAPLAVAEDTSS